MRGLSRYFHFRLYFNFILQIHNIRLKIFCLMTFNSKFLKLLFDTLLHFLWVDISFEPCLDVIKHFLILFKILIWMVHLRRHAWHLIKACIHLKLWLINDALRSLLQSLEIIVSLQLMTKLPSEITLQHSLTDISIKVTFTPVLK